MSEHIRKPMDDNPEEEPEQEEGALPLLSLDEFYDLLMEQQEQM